ncbi:MAG: hypothetical protein GF350_13790 [Chitinivibrionales bacterium]|nr:hypothetical protein [Chitinivibrionales bacterium]
MNLRYLILSIVVSGQSMCAQAPTQFFSSAWGEEFKLMRNDSGDTISIGGLFATAGSLYVYDMAEGRIVVIDSSGNIVTRIMLESFGRGTYAGDDFVVRDDEILFLNTVDKRLEVYDRETGAHTQSLPYPRNIFDTEQRRIRRTITKIFIDGNRIILGNSYHFFYFDEALGKKAKNTTVQSIEPGMRLMSINAAGKIGVGGGKVIAAGKVIGPVPVSHFPVDGKRLVFLNDTVYSLVLTADSVKIMQVR